MIFLTIKFDSINLEKATLKGLYFLMELCLEQEQYERCQLIQNEIDKRKSKLKSKYGKTS